MKKYLTKLAALLLGIVTAFSLFGCKGGDESSTGGNSASTGGSSTSPDDSSSPDEEPIKYTDYKLVSGGKTDYKIVVPEDAPMRVNMAATELTSFFMEATGLRLETVTDAEEVSDCYISLGASKLLDEADVTPDYTALGINGYSMKTVGKNVYIAGGAHYGTLFGVYEFLHQTFGYEYYAENCYTLEKNATEVRLPAFDMDVTPDIQQLMANYGVVYNDAGVGRRLGVEAWNEIWIYANGTSNAWHNTQIFVPYDENHPDWFSRGEDGDKHFQLCLSNEEMYEQAFLPKLKQVLLANPDLYNISITQMDKNYWCRCDKCKADFEHYGTDAGNMIKFINKCSRDIKAWLKEEGIQRDDLTFCMFAYHKTTEPPVKTLADGSYAPFDDDVKLEDNVAVWYAPIYAKWTDALTDESNKMYEDYGRKWKAIANQMFIWAYETNFSQYLVPFDTFGAMQDNYRFYKELNTKMLFSQGQFNQQGSVYFNNLKVYLQSKLRWNVNADVNKLTQRWFDNYFGAASAEMKKFYDELRLYMSWQNAPKEEGGLGYAGTIYAPSSTAEYWSKGILDRFTAQINAAYKAIEPLKATDAALYSKLSDRICLESIFVRYLQLANYTNLYSSSELYEMRKSFRADVMRLGVSNIREGASLSSFYEAWQI